MTPADLEVRDLKADSEELKKICDRLGRDTCDGRALADIDAVLSERDALAAEVARLSAADPIVRNSVEFSRVVAERDALAARMEDLKAQLVDAHIAHGATRLCLEQTEAWVAKLEAALAGLQECNTIQQARRIARAALVRP